MADEPHPGLQNISAEHAVPRVCLNMIVGNESKIIERCLASALPFIDTWCISCNGSDGTEQKIRRFLRDVPGKVVHEPFKNFAQARNAALDAARTLPGWEYALLIDADMVLMSAPDKSALTAPAYECFQHDVHRSHANTRLVRRDVPAKYLGVTHEYLSVEGVQLLPGLDIHDVGDGGSKSDKGERDIRLLEEGLKEEPDNERYMFYLANTYREMDRPHRAVPWYKKRIERGGWDEEIWSAHHSLALCYKELGDEPNFFKACLGAYNARPVRGESIKLLAQYCREKSCSDTALLFAEALAATPQPDDRLFLERDAYDFGADQEFAISGFYSKLPRRRELGYAAGARLTTHPNSWVRDEARKNFTFYAKSAGELYGADVREINWHPSDGWAPMNPSVCIGSDGRRLVLVRTVNYVVADGEYPTNDGSGIIRTKNHIVEFDANWEIVNSTMIHDATETPRNKFPVEGFEDCRLWRGDENYYVSATVRDLADNPDGQCEMVIACLDDQRRVVDMFPIRDYEHDKTQKNWMPIVGRPWVFLYLCDPTVVIDVVGGLGTVELFRSKPNACLVDLRGGSQLVPHDGGWLCLTHEVAWRPERVYLHRFVRFDAEFKIIGLSDPFYFVKVGIEFCAGLVREGDKLIASFGVNDASAHLAFFDVNRVNDALKSL